MKQIITGGEVEMIVLKIFHLIVALAVIAGVLLQSGKSAGLSGVIDGGATTFFGKKKGLDEKLSRFTTIVAIIFMITSLILAFVK
ncbi:MAG: preprotein translocase subunit SecG [Halanaerobiales bacterium]|nr:preprotein translocase subunit SecG [Halanaerobiales bacterium]